jgi:hypothetical protein
MLRCKIVIDAIWSSAPVSNVVPGGRQGSRWGTATANIHSTNAVLRQPAAADYIKGRVRQQRQLTAFTPRSGRMQQENATGRAVREQADQRLPCAREGPQAGRQSLCATCSSRSTSVYVNDSIIRDGVLEVQRRGGASAGCVEVAQLRRPEQGCCGAMCSGVANGVRDRLVLRAPAALRRCWPFRAAAAARSSNERSRPSRYPAQVTETRPERDRGDRTGNVFRRSWEVLVV